MQHPIAKKKTRYKSTAAQEPEKKSTSNIMLRLHLNAKIANSDAPNGTQTFLQPKILGFVHFGRRYLKFF